MQPKTTREFAFLAGVSESYIEKAKEICSFELADLVIEEGRKFGPVYRQFKDVRQAGLGDELRAGERDLDTAWLQAHEMRSAAQDSNRHRNPTKRDLANRIQELESEIKVLRGQLETNERSSTEFTPGPRGSGNQARELEKQRQQAIERADAAEAKLVSVTEERNALSAEIEGLKRIFHDAGLHAYVADELNMAEISPPG